MLAFESRLVKLEAALDRAGEEINRAAIAERRMDALLLRLSVRQTLLEIEQPALRRLSGDPPANDNC
jgi:hypothetical protein